jgi:tetratricopeptide (TPR) repeat protein/class 3 adenylate cyclase/TolB-like protein
LTGETESSILSSSWIPRRFTNLLRDKNSTPALEIAHVLFIDIVGYSKLPMDHQREQVEALQQVTSSTSEFTRAKSQEQLISLPTGDGMALVFFGNAEAPVTCSIELTRKLSGNPELKLRMGLHTGPVYRIADINANRNVSGGGINIAQRVMDCGDAGHILVSAALASVLKQVSIWSSALHDLGEVQVKHGVRVHVFNLLQDGVGNADTPAAVSRQRQVDGDRANFDGEKTRRQYRIGFGLGAATVAALLVATGFGIVKYNRRNISTPFSESAKLRSGRSPSRPAVALLGFKNLSGKPDAAWISPALTQMLGSQLSAGEQLLIIPSEQVTHGKIDLALPDEQALGPETLSRVRDNLGSDYVVLGSFLDQDGQVRVDLTVQDTAKGETIYTISDAGPDNKLPDVAARAGDRLRQKLGVAEASPLDAANAKAAQSESLLATRFYSEGIEKLHSFDTAGARDLLERAVSEDPNYALAHAALSEAWRSLGYSSKSKDEAKKAMDLSINLSRENRLAIEAQYRNSIGDKVGEAEIYKSLFTFYPESLDYGLSLAKSQYYNGEWQEANTTLDALQQLKSPDGDNPRIDHVRSAVAVASGDSKKGLALAERVELRATQKGARRLAAESLNIQCHLLYSLGDPAKAIAACDKARVIYSEIVDLGGEAKVWGQLATLASRSGDTVAGRDANERQIALLRKMGAAPGLSYAMTVAGELSANAGDYSRARKEYGEALALYQKVGEQQGISSSYGNLGWVYSLEGNLTEAVKNEELAIAIKHETKSKTELDLWLADLADVLVSEGDLPGAQKHLDEGFEVNAQTQNKSYSMYLHACRARLLFVQGAFEESRREAELALKVSQELNQETATEESRLMLARLDVEENHPQAAAETLRKSLTYFASKKEQANQVEARAILIQALLAMPFADVKHELAALAKAVLETQNETAMLTGHMQLARARAAFGDKKGAHELLTDVISKSQRMGNKPLLLEAKLTLAEIELQPGRSPATLEEIEQIAQQADALGLKLIASKARAALKKTTV